MKKRYKLELYEVAETDWDDSYTKLGEFFAWAYSKEQAFNYIKRRLHLFDHEYYDTYISYKYRVLS